MDTIAKTKIEKVNEFTTYEDEPSKRFGKSRKASKKTKTKTDAEFKSVAGEPLLPYDFDSKIYLEINTDVAEAGIEAAVHYVYQGIQEGRAYRYPEE